MVSIKTIKTFYDLHERVDRRPGDIFEVSERRAARLQELIPDYIEVVGSKPVEEEAVEAEAVEESKVDYSKMTTQQLAVLAKERGVMPRGRVSKATLVKILSEE